MSQSTPGTQGNERCSEFSGVQHRKRTSHHVSLCFQELLWLTCCCRRTDLALVRLETARGFPGAFLARLNARGCLVGGLTGWAACPSQAIATNEFYVRTFFSILTPQMSEPRKVGQKTICHNRPTFSHSCFSAQLTDFSPLTLTFVMLSPSVLHGRVGHTQGLARLAP